MKLIYIELYIPICLFLHLANILVTRYQAHRYFTEVFHLLFNRSITWSFIVKDFIRLESKGEAWV